MQDFYQKEVSNLGQFLHQIGLDLKISKFNNITKANSISKPIRVENIPFLHNMTFSSPELPRKIYNASKIDIRKIDTTWYTTRSQIYISETHTNKVREFKECRRFPKSGKDL